LPLPSIDPLYGRNKEDGFLVSKKTHHLATAKASLMEMAAQFSKVLSSALSCHVSR
jgi:hypothetical protein